MILRGPGGNEPFLVVEALKAGKTFEQAIAEAEKAGGFRCEQWWIDLNREVLLEAAGVKPKAAKAKGKG